jgi:hypothetical protein
MPVSNPSAFPPPRGGDQIISINAGTNHTGASVFFAGQSAGNNSSISDLILIGTNVGSQGWVSPGMEGTVAIGSHALAAYPDQGTTTTPSASVVIGGFAASVLEQGYNNVIIGDHAMQNTGASNSGDPANDNVVIGSQAGQNMGVNQRIDISVAIGSQVIKSAENVEGSVIIGAFAATNIGNVVSDCIIIGTQCCASDFGSTGEQTGVIVIGNQSDGTFPVGGQGIYIGNSNVGLGGSNNVIVGSACRGFGGIQCTVVGDEASGLGGNNNVVIGSSAGVWEPAVVSDIFILEVGNSQSSPNRRLLLGDFTGGNLIIGQTAPGTGFAGGATNTLGIPNGTQGTAPGAGGIGYLFASAGALSWRGTSGTVTQLAPA